MERLFYGVHYETYKYSFNYRDTTKDDIVTTYDEVAQLKQFLKDGYLVEIMRKLTMDWGTVMDEKHITTEYYYRVTNIEKDSDV
ncbi:MAG: hypothetical protein J7L21_04295 [Sulfurimonas sp.]|nr:hypothetical protein [Sulfurimonas sp.]